MIYGLDIVQYILQLQCCMVIASCRVKNIVSHDPLLTQSMLPRPRSVIVYCTKCGLQSQNAASVHRYKHKCGPRESELNEPEHIVSGTSHLELDALATVQFMPRSGCDLPHKSNFPLSALACVHESDGSVQQYD